MVRCEVVPTGSVHGGDALSSPGLSCSFVLRSRGTRERDALRFEIEAHLHTRDLVRMIDEAGAEIPVVPAICMGARRPFPQQRTLGTEKAADRNRRPPVRPRGFVLWEVIFNRI